MNINKLSKKEEELLILLNVSLINSFDANLFKQIVIENVSKPPIRVGRSDTIVTKVINHLCKCKSNKTWISWERS